jgi:uncharacterized phage-associated protein
VATGISAHDVARELLERLPGPGEVKLQKLLYYCQGWHLAFTGAPLFEEEIQAWANGPVVADLWRARKHGWAAPPAAELDLEQLGTIGFVVSRYGSQSGKELIRSTHNEDPWRHATEDAGDDDRPELPITIDALKAFFGTERNTPIEALASRILEDSDLRDEFDRANRAASGRQPVADTAESLEAFLDI